MLSVVVLFLSAGILSVLAQQETYSGPTEAYPGGLKYKPVDTTPTNATETGDQMKWAKLSLKQIEFSTDPTLTTDPNIKLSEKISFVTDSGKYIDMDGGSIGFVLSNTSGPVSVISKGLTLPSLVPDYGNPGMIYYDTTGKKVKLYNGTAWTDIGTGGGDGYWKTDGSGGIYYDGTATIGTIAAGTGAFYATGSFYSKAPTENQFGLVQKAYADAIKPSDDLRLECDKIAEAYDCVSPYTPSEGTYSEGDIRYDKVGICPDGYNIVYDGGTAKCGMYMALYTTDFREYGDWKYTPITYKYREFKFKKLTSSGTLYAGTIYANDITLASKTWHSETQYSFATDGAGGTKRGTAVCPQGYYMVGVEAWDNDGGGYCAGCLTGLKVKCAKL